MQNQPTQESSYPLQAPSQPTESLTQPIKPPKLLIAGLTLMYLISLSSYLYGNYLAGDGALWQMLLNCVILSMPLLLMYFSMGVLLMADKQKHMQGAINDKLAKIIYKTPRIAVIVVIFFITLFSLDVFIQGGNIWYRLAGFITHSVPSIILSVILYFAWKKDIVGFYAFLIGGLFFLRIIISNPLENLGIFMLFAGPMFCIAMLFWVNWKWVKSQENV